MFPDDNLRTIYPFDLKLETLVHHVSEVVPIVWGGRPVTGSASRTALGNLVSE